MKNIVNIIISLFITLNIIACNNAQSNKNTNIDIVKIEKVIKVYYFHFSHRCKTCVAVEEETLNALRELYPDKIESGLLTFQSVNMDEPEGEVLAEEINVSGQTLLFIHGEDRINLTNDGFMYAVTKPDKLKEKIKSTVDEMINSK